MLPLKNSRAVAFVGVLTGLCLAIQLAPRPPNVEFTSLFAFAIGCMFGIGVGAFFGGFVMFVNGFFSPWGFAGLNMPFQMLGMGIVGVAGGLYRRYLRTPNPAETAVFGAVLTVFYDFVTNLGVAMTYVIAGVDPTLAVVAAIGYGAPFSVIHVASNVAVFGIVFFPLLKAADQIVAVRRLG